MVYRVTIDGGFTCPNVDFLERLPPDMVIHRLNGDAPPDYLVAPAWCLDKPTLLQAIVDELERRDSWQGRLLKIPDSEAR